MATNENIYDEIEIEDMTYDAKLQLYHYPCPCGDRFEITLDDLREGETDIGICPSCSLQIRIIYEIEDLPRPEVEAEGQKVPGMVMSEQQVTALAAATIRSGEDEDASHWLGALPSQSEQSYEAKGQAG
ncbi:Diphthamide biosynthesis protein 3 [Friedmanniomyces endolithicus]|nr:Diphthamide biosynthesis protein 3 [Friedmanniomyces endolithicus]